MYNKLTAMVAKNKKDVEENPWPLIEKLQDEIIVLRALLHSIEDVVYPPMQIHLETSYPIYATDYRVDAMKQVSKVKDILGSLDNSGPIA